MHLLKCFSKKKPVGEDTVQVHNNKKNQEFLLIIDMHCSRGPFMMK